ncbi:MAG: DNA translocase FtsK 4TM domain-containing protein [Sulfurimonas sp.]|nr:DNA translocase FtsK 4TM domain-containing protein [Sulfurimonas sp.]
MKETLFIIFLGIFIYLGVSTIFGDSELMGSYGSVFASYNQHLFGYLSFIYLFALLVPIYFLYKNTTLDFRKAQITIASILLFLSTILAQAMLIQGPFRGKLGADFVDFLSPYIGLFGLWMFWMIITMVSIVVLLDKTTQEISLIIIEFIKNKISKGSAKSKKVEAVTSESLHTHEDIHEVVEEPIIKDIPLESDFIEDEPKEDIDKPAYLRKSKSQTKDKKNIINLASKVKEQNSTLIVDELEENAKLLETIEKGSAPKPKNFTLPSVKFLQKPDTTSHTIDESEVDDKIRYLIEKLAHFKIDGDVVRTYAGPVVSTFEFKPAANVKVSKILNLQDDLAMALSAETIRIQAPIPGKDVVGIEIPNDTVDTIFLRELLDSKLFKESASPLTIALGKDIVGKPFITDLKKLPHLLIAGTTGSGKSVGINAMILSLLYKNSPDQLRLLMIDPKMLEFSIYNDIPHLLTPVITKPKQAIVALNNMVHEMERRYELMSETRTKNIENYNEKVKKEGGEHFPYIVVIIDELADLMMTSGKDVEHSIARLAQMARASGIHLIVATQRPSVDVVTGLIKANLPSRISYRVGQKVDSKIILDQMGAESLLGRGDMLFTPPGSTGLVRLHAPWSTEEEIEKIVDFIKSQRDPNYDKSFLVEENETVNSGVKDTYEELDPLYNDAKNVVLTDRKTSISYLQRKLQIGYNRSARVIEQLENEGVLSAPNTKGIREIL